MNNFELSYPAEMAINTSEQLLQEQLQDPQFELMHTQDFIILGQPLTNTNDENQYTLKLIIFNLGNAQLDNFNLTFTPANDWQVNSENPDKEILPPKGRGPITQVIYLIYTTTCPFELHVTANFILDSEQITEEGVITKLPPPILYAEMFRVWSSSENFELIIDQASTQSIVYDKLNSDFNEKLKEPITVNKLISFLLEENHMINGTEDKTYRECVLYFIITAVTNSQCETKDKKTITGWIQSIDNLASLFEFSNDHCYLFTLIYTLEFEKEKKIKLFNQQDIDQKAFLHIIRDNDLCASQLDEKKNQLLYYLLKLLVELKYYKHAYRIYNGFIDENVQESDVQIDIIKTLTAETSLVTTFSFLRRSQFFQKAILQNDVGSKIIKTAVLSMLEITLQKNKINELIHLPFNSNEKIIIQQICQVVIEVKFKDENNNNNENIIGFANPTFDENEIKRIQPILEKHHVTIVIARKKGKEDKQIRLPFELEEKNILNSIMESHNYCYYRIIHFNLFNDVQKY